MELGSISNLLFVVFIISELHFSDERIEGLRSVVDFNVQSLNFFLLAFFTLSLLLYNELRICEDIIKWMIIIE